MQCPVIVFYIGNLIPQLEKRYRLLKEDFGTKILWDVEAMGPE